jgi:UDP-N-acetyl-D-mannosaminuronate dehydrogenase
MFSADANKLVLSGLQYPLAGSCDGYHCIAVSLFIVEKTPHQARIIRMARDVNLHETVAITRRHANCNPRWSLTVTRRPVCVRIC